MHRHLGWDDLLYVLAVGRAGSLSGAARQLKVNHSTVYRRVERLEEQLRVRLFDRRREGYAPTPTGEAMIELAARMDEEVLGLERRLAGEDLRPSGTLRVTTTGSLVSVVTPLLSAFRCQYPEITIELVTSYRTLSLSRRDADVAIRPTSRPDESLVGRKVASLAFAVYGSTSYLAVARSADLDRSHEWIGLDEGLSHSKAHAWLSRNVEPERIGLRASSFDAVAQAASAGMGLALLPCYMAQARPELVRCTEPLADVATDLWLLVHEDLRQAARVRAFLDFMAAGISEIRPLLEGIGIAPRRTLPPCPPRRPRGGLDPDMMSNPTLAVA